MMTNRKLDLNIFFREEWDDNTQTSYYSPLITVDVYDYWQFQHPDHGLCSDHAEIGVLVECTPEETQALRRAYPEAEYGYDWWITYEEALLPVTVHEKLKSKLLHATIPVVR